MDIIIHYIQEFTYIGIFIFLIWCGIGFPLPEDVILIAAGFLVYEEVTNLYFTLIVTFIGVLAGDLLIYHFGKKFGLDIMSHKRFRKILSERRLVKIEKFFNRYGTPLVFYGRFIMFFRAPTYLSAGALGVRLATFIFYDFLAAMIYIPLIVLIGYHFGEEIELAVQYVREVEYLIVIFVLLFILYIIRWRRNRLRRTEDEKSKSSSSTDIS